MKRTHPIFNFGKGASEGSKKKDASFGKKDEKSTPKTGGFSGSPEATSVPIEHSQTSTAEESHSQEDDKRIVLKTASIVKQAKRKSSPIPPEGDESVREGWNPNCRWTYASTSSTIRERNARQFPSRPPRIYASSKNPNRPGPGRLNLIRIQMPPAIRPHQSTPEDSCWKRFTNKCGAARGKVRRMWRALIKKKREWDRWNPNKSNPIIACINESKLAGLKESIKPNRGILYRMMWVALFFLALGVGTKMSWDTYVFNKTTPILFAFESKEINTKDLPYPSVTVVPNASFKKMSISDAFQKLDEAKGYTKTSVAKLLYFMKHTCHPKTSASSRHGLNHMTELSQLTLEEHLGRKEIQDSPDDLDIAKIIVPFMKQASPNCSELLSYCSFNMKTSDSCPLFVSTYETTGGGCSFNRIPDSDLYKSPLSMKSLWSRDEFEKQDLERSWKNWTLGSHLQNIHKKPRNGSLQNGPMQQYKGGSPWGLSFVITMDDTTLGCPQFESSGARISITVPGIDVDVERDNIAVPPNHDVTIKLYPDLTIADEDIRPIPPSVRGCHFEDEGNLTFYKMYNQENCHRECMAEFILKSCRCTLLSLPNSAGQHLCNTRKFDCVREAERILMDPSKDLMTAKCSHCLPSCSSMKLRMETIMTPISKDRPPLLQSERPNVTTSMANAYYAESSVIAKVRQRRHSDIETVREVGAIYESTNDVSWLGVARIIVGLTFFIPTAYATYKLLQLTCLSSIFICRKFNISIFGLRKRLRVHPSKRPRKRVRFADEEAGIPRVDNPQNEFPRSTNFDVFLLDSSHIILPMPPSQPLQDPQPSTSTRQCNL